MAWKILIIDDEELIIRSLTKLLEKSGYDVIIAKNGQDALIIIEEEKVDLILSDIRMPGKNGVEAVAAIYKRIKEKIGKIIPVIFITGYADATMEKEAQLLSPVAYIYKPFDQDELLDKINVVLGKRTK